MAGVVSPFFFLFLFLSFFFSFSLFSLLFLLFSFLLLFFFFSFLLLCSYKHKKKHNGGVVIELLALSFFLILSSLCTSICPSVCPLFALDVWIFLFFLLFFCSSSFCCACIDGVFSCPCRNIMAGLDRGLWMMSRWITRDMPALFWHHMVHVDVDWACISQCEWCLVFVFCLGVFMRWSSRCACVCVCVCVWVSECVLLLSVSICFSVHVCCCSVYRRVMCLCFFLWCGGVDKGGCKGEVSLTTISPWKHRFSSDHRS